MHRLTLAIALLLGTISIALAQSPAPEDHSAHHPAQGTAPALQAPPAQSEVKSGQEAESKPRSAQASGGATGPQMGGTMGPQMGGMMPGMMQMMQGMQGMMRMMHPQAQAEQMQPGRTQPRQNCPMMLGATGDAADATRMQAMMQMMQGMMQMMQAQMQSGQVQSRP